MRPIAIAILGLWTCGYIAGHRDGFDDGKELAIQEMESQVNRLTGVSP